MACINDTIYFDGANIITSSTQTAKYLKQKGEKIYHLKLSRIQYFCKLIKKTFKTTFKMKIIKCTLNLRMSAEVLGLYHNQCVYLTS